MAPEQVEGKEADARTDIFAFGAVVYEMVTGKKAFEGKTQPSLIAAILERDPPAISATAGGTAIDWIVRQCLAKDPGDRWQTARDLLHALQHATDARPDASLPMAALTARRRERALAAGVLLVMVVTVTLLVPLLLRREPSPQAAIRFIVPPPPGTAIAQGPAAPQVAVSPDGRQIAFAAQDASGRNQLWLRPLENLNPQRLPGTEGSELPFWSPDGRFIAFFTDDRKLKKMPAAGGPPQTICDLPAAPTWGGGAWSREGTIIFALAQGKGLYAVASSGGAPTPLTTLDRARQERAHLWPSFLPDGKHFIYLVHSLMPDNRGIYLGALDSKDATRLLDTQVRAAYAAPGHLLFVQDGTLMAQTFDVTALRLSGDPVPVAQQLAYNPTVGLGRTTFSTSDTGVLAYRAGGVGGIPIGQLTWFDRAGKPLGTAGEPAQYSTFWLSPDGRRVMFDRYDARAKANNIWTSDVAGGAPARFTFDAAGAEGPVWSPDGTRIVFRSPRKGPANLYVKPATGAGADSPLLESKEEKWAVDWSLDGRFVLSEVVDPTTGSDLWVVPLDGVRKPFVLLATEFEELQGQFSPDGRWFAYRSNESGAFEVFVQPFPPTGAKWQISTDGGSQPRWRRDGKELFYLAADRKLTAVEVKGGSTFETGARRALFQPRISGFSNDYVVGADGQRFLVNTLAEETTAIPVTVVVNWPAEVKR